MLEFSARAACLQASPGHPRTDHRPAQHVTSPGSRAGSADKPGGDSPSGTAPAAPCSAQPDRRIHRIHPILLVDRLAQHQTPPALPLLEEVVEPAVHTGRRSAWTVLL